MMDAPPFGTWPPIGKLGKQTAVVGSCMISCLNRHPRRSSSTRVNTLIDHAVSTSISVLQQSSCHPRLQKSDPKIHLSS